MNMILLPVVLTTRNDCGKGFIARSKFSLDNAVLLSIRKITVIYLHFAGVLIAVYLSVVIM